MISESSPHKELDLIQAIVGRMAQNSFQVKAWLIGVLAAMVAFEKDAIFAGASGDKHTALLLNHSLLLPARVRAPASGDKHTALLLNCFLFLPVLCFWYLDAFFLSTERLYRELYKWVVKHRPHTNSYLFDLNTFARIADGKEEQLLLPKNSLWNMMISKTLLPFYIVPLLFVVGLLIFNLKA